MRIFDVDFTEVQTTLTRPGTFVEPNITVLNDEAAQQLILDDEVGGLLFYEGIDLSQLTLEGRSFQPLQVMVNRPYSVPRGTKFNPNITVQNEEYIFIWYSNVAAPDPGLTQPEKETFIQALRRVGMNSSPIINLETPYEEEQPNLSQLLWASSAAFLPSLDTALTMFNGQLPDPTPVPIGPADIVVITNSMRQVDSSEWGSMDIVQGPMLHIYRLVTNYSQNMGGMPAGSPCLNANGTEYQWWAPLNVKVVCQEVDLTSEEYLTTAYNTLTRMTPGGPN